VIERLALAGLRALDPETAHALALSALNRGFAGGDGAIASPRLRAALCGIALPNPVGTAAGFDKNAVAIAATLRAGFGFVELGAVTPRPQPGSARPRVFRLPQDRAIINRYGFNNDGLEVIAGRISAWRAGGGDGVIAVNLGANADSPDRVADYVPLIERLRGLADVLTINVSSPNTANLRAMQGREALAALLDACGKAAQGAPLALKIAPDLTEAEIADIAQIALERRVGAIIATNTTLSRDGLRGAHAREAGGLSGRPLYARSTEVLRQLRALTQGRLALIGVGGIDSPETAYAKIRAGADAVQLYTGLVYGGISLGARIAKGLDALLERDGFATVAEAVGADPP
jgi:dihydroorotate dehydrogenase